MMGIARTSIAGVTICSWIGLGTAALANQTITCPANQHYTPSIVCTYANGFVAAGACAQGVKPVTVPFLHIVDAHDPGCGSTNHCIVCQYNSPGIASPTYNNPVSQQKAVPTLSVCQVNGSTATCSP